MTSIEKKLKSFNKKLESLRRKTLQKALIHQKKLGSKHLDKVFCHHNDGGFSHAELLSPQEICWNCGRWYCEESLEDAYIEEQELKVPEAKILRTAKDGGLMHGCSSCGHSFCFKCRPSSTVPTKPMVAGSPSATTKLAFQASPSGA